MIKNQNKKIVREGRLSRLIEASVDNANLLVSAQAITAIFQGIAEDLAGIEQKNVLPLKTQLLDAFGPEVTDSFCGTIVSKVRELLDEVSSAQDAVATAVKNLETVADGGQYPTDMDNAVDGDGMDGNEDSFDDELGMGDKDIPAPDMKRMPMDSNDDMEPLGDAPGAAGRARKEAMTIRGRQIESAVKKLRESKNPDALVLNEFRLNLTKHSVKEAVLRTAKTFRIDLSDVIDIVVEAKDKSKKKNPFGAKKAPPFQKKNVKKVEENTNPGFQAFIDKKKAEKKDKPAEKSAVKTEDKAKTEPKKKVDEKADEADPCWKGYKMAGTKKKDGKTVPNCVKETRGTVAEKTTVRGNISANRKAEDRNKNRPFKKIAEAVPQGSKSPAEMRAAQQAEKDAKNGVLPAATDKQVAADAPNTPINMPGKTLSGTPPKAPTGPMQPQQQQQPQQPQQPAQPVNKNAAAAAQGQVGSKNTQTVDTSNPSGNASNSPNQTSGSNQMNPEINSDDEEIPANGQNQIIQSGDDGPKDVQPKDNANIQPATEKPGFKNTTNNGVTMMSTTRPVPKPEHSLMGSGMASPKIHKASPSMSESRLLMKFIKESEANERGLDAASQGLPKTTNPYAPGTIDYMEWNRAYDSISLYFDQKPIDTVYSMAMDEEDKPETHVRLLGYVIRDNRGHTHGCKWIQNPDHPCMGTDEGSPKVYKNRAEAQELADKWTIEEKEHDDVMLDNIVFTIGAMYSNGEIKFPA